MRGINELQPWAMQMLDASAKLPSGVLRGNIRAFGDYDECVELQGPVSPQFCLADIQVHDAAYPRLHELLERATLGRREREIMHNRTGYMVPNYLPMFSHIQMGACVPASCGPRDTEMLISEVLKQSWLEKYLSYDIVIDENNCSGYQPSSDSLWIVLSILGVIISMTVIGTLHGLLVPYKGMKTELLEQTYNKLYIIDEYRWLRAFNFASNWSRIWRAGSLRYLEGVRGVSAAGIVAEHQILQHLITPLTITQVIVIMFYASVLPSVGSGPLWYEYLELTSQACRRNWHRNLLYIHNYGENHYCVGHAWYGSADFQLFLLAPIFIWLLQKFRRIATFTVILMIVIPTLELFCYILATKNVALLTVGA
ncbi:hypothetical protein B566_EDAN004216, partial [Ephemera danica]